MKSDVQTQLNTTNVGWRFSPYFDLCEQKYRQLKIEIRHSVNPSIFFLPAVGLSLAGDTFVRTIQKE
jgi:hypothetical protein